MRDEAREKRRDEIEVAAYEILEQKGFAGLSILSVAKSAKTSNETIYRWYGDKTGLFHALIARNADVIAAEISDQVDLESLGVTLLATLTGPRAIALNRAAAADPSGELGRAIAQGGRARIMPQIISAIQTSLPKGDPTEIAEVWISLLIGDLQVRRTNGSLLPLTTAEHHTRSKRALDLISKLYGPL